MISALKSKAIGVAMGGLALLSAFLYWQHVTLQRDAYRAESERQRERAEILLDSQQYQRQQIRTLNESLAARDRTLATIAEDIRASTMALEQLGERDAQARDWLDSDVPDGVVDWLRELQAGGSDGAGSMPDGAGPPYQ
ncbi:hypothetical protein [Vreelandella populi]|uniref:hypothetical protein n=1 Tax=Vreelandella populi TaxID=2498858 RepID=UPI000F8C7540|nr:hypothetical protein [Halomonas populi]RUR51514.1 hypothetical protein ELY40_17105 [Halomonas populi]